MSNTVAAGLGSATGLALTIFVAHRLGLRTLGEYAVIATVYSVFGVIDSARTQDLTTRYASGGGNEPRRLRFLLGAVAVVAAVAGAVGFGAVSGSRAAGGALIAWLGAIAQFMTAETVAATQVQHKFQRLAIANSTGALVGSGVAALLLGRLGLLGLGIGLFTTSALSRALLFTDAGVRAQVRGAPSTREQLQGQTLSLALLNGAAQLVNFTDIVSIRSLASATQAGVYRSGSQLPTLTVGLIYRGFDTLMPRLASANEEDAARAIRHASPYLGVAVGAVLGLIIGVRRPLVRLMLGHNNHDAQTVLWLFAVVWMVNSVIHPAALLLIARRRQRSIVRLVGLEYAANLVLTVALVPALGAVGSAIATLITLAASNLVLLPRILAKDLPSLPIARHLLIDCLLPTALAAAVTIGATTLVGA